MAISEPFDVLVRVSAQAGGESLSHFHDFFSHYVQERFRRSLAGSLRLAAFELLENAILYGSISLPVVFEFGERRSFVVIRVSNAAITARVTRILELVEKLKVGAEATYLGQVQRSAASPGRAQLGLARVAHEAGMKLDAAIVGNRVVVAAHCRN